MDILWEKQMTVISVLPSYRPRLLDHRVAGKLAR
jgi:hypothetical protein